MENFNIPETMKAMTLVAYDKLQLATVPVPKPGPGEVLCRIKSVAICGSDPKMIHGDYAWTNWPHKTAGAGGQNYSLRGCTLMASSIMVL